MEALAYEFIAITFHLIHYCSNLKTKQLMSYSSYLNVATNINLSTVGLFVATLITVYVTHWIYKWRNSKCNIGVLPPGSMGLPFIGETLQLIIPSPSLDLPPFIATRIKR